MKIVTVNPFKCVGCRNCELACAFATTHTTCERRASLIRVNHYIDEQSVIPLTCMHCQEAWCLDVCPAGAIVRDDTTNAVIIQAEKCAGCKMCILACPYGNIHFDAASSVSRKCDLCQGNPRCVGHCIAAALNYEEAEDYSARIRKRFDYHLAGIINAGRH